MSYVAQFRRAQRAETVSNVCDELWHAIVASAASRNGEQRLRRAMTHDCGERSEPRRRAMFAYRAVPYRTVPHRTVPYRTVPYRTVPYRTVPYGTVRYGAVPYRTVPYRTVPYRTVLYRTVPCRAVPHRTVPCRTVPYRAIMHCIPKLTHNGLGSTVT